MDNGEGLWGEDNQGCMVTGYQAERDRGSRWGLRHAYPASKEQMMPQRQFVRHSDHWGSSSQGSVYLVRPRESTWNRLGGGGQLPHLFSTPTTDSLSFEV